MTKTMFTIYDSKTNAFDVPQFAKTRGDGIRAFTSAVLKGNTMLSEHPADFTLFELGYYDEQSGQFSIHEAKINLGTVAELVGNAKQENQNLSLAN